MMPVQAGAGALDYFPCRYGASRAVFRGPARDLSGPYVALLGGSATFGKYVAQPFPDLVEGVTGVPCANLGALNAGPDFYLSDPGALDVAARAQVAVVQIAGAEGLSNRFYTVHSRRNDRFLAATPALRALFSEVDFADIHFTRHLLTVLARIDPQRFAEVRRTLKATWIARMQELLVHLPPRRLLLWLADAPPGVDEVGPEAGALPLFVDPAMLAALHPAIQGLVVALPSTAERKEAPDDRLFPETEAALARCLPGAQAHRETAALLAPRIDALLARRPAPLILHPALATA